LPDQCAARGSLRDGFHRAESSDRPAAWRLPHGQLPRGTTPGTLDGVHDEGGTMSEIATTVDTNPATVNATDTHRRPHPSERAGSEEGRGVDGVEEGEGRGAVSDMVAGAQQQYPGHRFRRTSGIDTHHNQIRFTWEVTGPDGALTVAGTDVGVLGSDGRLEQ